jgi:hypothetical protein
MDLDVEAVRYFPFTDVTVSFSTCRFSWPKSSSYWCFLPVGPKSHSNIHSDRQRRLYVYHCLWFDNKLICLKSAEEIPLLREIQLSVESLYQEGRPIHQHGSATCAEYDSQGSSIFVVDHQDFIKMDAAAIQEIFRRRHILVLDVPAEDLAFDEEGLSTLGSLDHPREMLGMAISSPCMTLSTDVLN